MYKPHIRKVDSATGWQAYHCSLQRSPACWWHEYGETPRIAYDKMMARTRTHAGANYEPPTDR